jgi:hypothetical protein
MKPTTLWTNKTMKIIHTLSALVLLSAVTSSATEQPAVHGENVLVIGSPPAFGTLDGVRFQRRTVAQVTQSQAVYMCFRDRQAGDFKIGERVFGSDMPATATEPSGVIHRIILELPASGDNRSYYEIPPEFYRDLAEHHLNWQSKSQTLFSIARKGATLTIFLQGGDAAGSYVVNWIIEGHKVRRVIAAGESDSGGVDPWLELKKIDPPKIINTPDKKG